MEKLEALFSLIKSGVFETPVEDGVKNFITDEKAEELCALAGEHDMSHIVSYVFDENGLVSSAELRKKCRERWLKAVYRHGQMQYELEQICNALEESGVKYIPLKGSILRSLYKQPWMRTSCDIDVFVEKEQLSVAIKTLEEKLSYKHEYGSSHDESLYAPSGVHLELHYDLIEESWAGAGAELLKDVWNYTQTVDGFTNQKHMTDEMFYFYHVLHMTKHFEYGGCGIRPFLDLMILNENIDETQVQAREKLLEQGGYIVFEKACKALSQSWFASGEKTELIEQMQAFVLSGGVYGTLDNRIALQSAQKGSKFAYWMSRIFLPYAQLKLVFPVLKKYKWLTPFCQVMRWCKILFRKGGAKKSLREVSASATLTDERRERTTKMIQELGLKK